LLLQLTILEIGIISLIKQFLDRLPSRDLRVVQHTTLHWSLLRQDHAKDQIEYV